MANSRFIWMAISLLLAIASHAYEPKEGKVTATLGHFWNRTNFSGPNENRLAPWQDGIGLIATGDSSSKGSIEVGFFQMSKRFIRKSQGKYIGQKAELVQINMGYRWWLSPYFSTSLSFFSSYTKGSPNTYYNDFAPDPAPKTSAEDITEYGFDTSIQAQVWESGRYSVVLEPRYSYSVTKKFKESGDHYGVFLGIRYLLQAKEKIEESHEL